MWEERNRGGGVVPVLPGAIANTGCGWWWSLDLQVCTGWRRVCSELMLPLDFSWATRGLDGEKTNPLTDLGLGGVLGRFRAVRSLNLCGCDRITDAGLATIGAGCPNLESLDLHGCEQITDAGLATIGAGCPNLESLDLICCSRITDAGLATIGAGCRVAR